MSVTDAGDGAELTAPDGTQVPVPKPESPAPRAIRVNGETVGTWGESETGWWGSALGDVQTFDSEDDAKQWVTEQLL